MDEKTGRHNFMAKKHAIETLLRAGKTRKATYRELGGLGMTYAMFCRYVNALADFDKRTVSPPRKQSPKHRKETERDRRDARSGPGERADGVEQHGAGGSRFRVSQDLSDIEKIYKRGD